MRLVKNKIRNGFSIIETIIVISILSIVLSGGVVTFIEKRGLTLLKNAQANMINALEQAQNRATTGVGTTKHGVHIETQKIVTFEGDTYTAGSGVETILPFSIYTNQANLNIIFNRLSGKPNASTTIILNNIDGATKTVTVTNEGLIIPE